MDVYLVWHVRHARNLDGSPTQHRDPDGELAFDEEFDDFKIIGAYADEPSADAAIARARRLQGFRDEPECFMIDAYTVGEDRWTEGFVSEPVHPTDHPATSSTAAIRSFKLWSARRVFPLPDASCTGAASRSLPAAQAARAPA